MFSGSQVSGMTGQTGWRAQICYLYVIVKAEQEQNQPKTSLQIA